MPCFMSVQLPMLGLGPSAFAVGMPTASTSGIVPSQPQRNIGGSNQQGAHWPAAAPGHAGLPGGLSPTASTAMDVGSAAFRAAFGDPLASFAYPAPPSGFAGFRPRQPHPQWQLDLTLLLGAEAVYGPTLLEERNLLLAGGKVVGILEDTAAEALRGALPGLVVQDCRGCVITPGFIDCHCHITGGGGEAGPASRCVAYHGQQPLHSLACCRHGYTCPCGVSSQSVSSHCDDHTRVLPGDPLALPVAYCHSKDELYVDRALVLSHPRPPGPL